MLFSFHICGLFDHTIGSESAKLLNSAYKYDLLIKDKI